MNAGISVCLNTHMRSHKYHGTKAPWRERKIEVFGSDLLGRFIEFLRPAHKIQLMEKTLHERRSIIEFIFIH